MDESQYQSLYQSIAISTGKIPGPVTPQQRSEAYTNLEQFKKYDGRVAGCIDLIGKERHFIPLANNTTADLTVSVKLYALDVLHSYIKKNYTKINDSERLGLRWSVVSAARQIASNSEQNKIPQIEVEERILGNKIAALLAELVVRDFPQRWTSFFTDVFAPNQQGLWGNNAIGTSIVLEALKIITEECTDSDFNAKIPTIRRNEVLLGMNEISPQLLPLLTTLLSEQYSSLCTYKNTIKDMEAYLSSNGRNVSQMSAEEKTMYDATKKKVNVSGGLLKDCLETLERFCHSMPIEWMFGSKGGFDFINVFLHLFRETTPPLQDNAVICIKNLALRKLEFDQWFRLVSSLPQAVSEYNQAVQQELLVGKQQSDLYILQLSFHRSLSKTLSGLISSSIAHITTDKDIVKGSGPKVQSLTTYLSLLNSLLEHPSGRVCTEQLTMWLALLRDPQIVDTKIISPFLPTVFKTFIDKVRKIRWEDVEDQIHPMSNMMEESWDDEEDYITWLGEYRSKTSVMYRFIANQEPEMVTNTLLSYFESVLSTHGNGEPRNHLDPKTGCLTNQSDPCMAFDSLILPMDNSFNGLPTWTMQPVTSTTSPEKAKICKSVQANLNRLASLVIGWKPSDPLLRLRRASFLVILKYCWKHDPTSLPMGVDALLENLSAKDDWNPNSNIDNLSGETIALRKKAGTALVSISKHIPDRLVPWLSQLSERSASLLSTNDLLPANRMHLFEFLSCVATAVDDPVARANFIGEVMSSSLKTLEEMSDCVGSMDNFMVFMGIAQAGSNPGSVIERAHVEETTSKYARFYSALNQLLSVGKRCHQAARKRPNCGLPLQNLSAFASNTDVTFESNFPDEGPVGLNDLSYNDPFVPLWPRILPTLIRVIDLTLRLWHTEYQAVLLANPAQRYVYAISDDEAFLAKHQNSNNSAKNGGVFGEGGTAGSVVTGCDRRQLNLAPRWSGWFNELRNGAFQLLGLLAEQRVLFAPEMSSLFPQLVSVLSDQTHLRSMEHRHINQYLKQFIENLILSCPSTLYHSHMSPIIIPVLEHMQARLAASWAPILETNYVYSKAALSTQTCDAAAAVASRGGDEWFGPYYARGGVYVGELDSVTSETVVEKNRIELTRSFCDVVQVALALKSEWGLVLANIAKEESALKKNDVSRLTVGPNSRLNDGKTPVNADGTPRGVNQAALEARQLKRIHYICKFLLLDDEKVAGPLVLSVIQCLTYPDAYTCRRATRICHRMLEAACSVERYTNLLGYRLFAIVVKAIVTEPKWMVGMEWEMIALLRDIYCRLVLGQTLMPGGQGPGLQQPALGPNSYEQAKNVNNPLQGGGVLIRGSDLPRQILVDLPGIDRNTVNNLDKIMREKRAAKDQKDALRELLRTAAAELQSTESSNGTSGTGGNDDLFGRALAEESLLNQAVRNSIPNLPEKLMTNSKMVKQKQKAKRSSGVDVLGQGGLRTIFG